MDQNVTSWGGKSQVRPGTMMKIMLERGGWPGAWTSSAWRSHHGTTPARQVSTRELTKITKAEPIQFHAITNSLAPVYITQGGAHTNRNGN
jgi:hypothetical protein